MSTRARTVQDSSRTLVGRSRACNGLACALVWAALAPGGCEGDDDANAQGSAQGSAAGPQSGDRKATQQSTRSEETEQSASQPQAPQLPKPPWTVETRLRHASHEVPKGAPTVLVHATEHFDPRKPLRLVVFLHGWRGCIRKLAHDGTVRCRPKGTETTGWGLVARHDAADSPALLVIPQLAWRARDGSPGRFARPEFARTWLNEVLNTALRSKLGSARDMDDVASIALVSHSAGYETALTLLNSEIRSAIRAVVLMDSLYGGAPQFAQWLKDGPGDRRLLSLYTGGGSTRRQSRRLARRMRASWGRDRVALDPEGSAIARWADRPVVVDRASHPHGAIPRKQWTEVVRALGP